MVLMNKVAEFDPPAGFSDEHSALWRTTVSAITSRPHLVPVLEIYVRNVVRMRVAERHINAHGEMVSAPRTGLPIPNPYLAIANKSAAIVQKLANEFCLPQSDEFHVDHPKKPVSPTAAPRSNVVVDMPSKRLLRLTGRHDG